MQITNNNPIKFKIKIYSKKSRDQLLSLVNSFFNDAGIAKYAEDVFACIDELIKNAIKANYKFITILKSVEKQLIKEESKDSNPDKVKEKIYDLIRKPSVYEKMVTLIKKYEDISVEVREVLNEESKYINIANKVYREQRDKTTEEKQVLLQLNKLKNIRKEINEMNISTLLKLENNGHSIQIEVTNTCPILEKDLERIHKKREEYKNCWQAGRECEFFVNNIDTSEAGFGLGYAKIDSFLNNMGLNTDNAVKISSSKSTSAKVSIPIDKLKALTDEAELLVTN